MKLLTFEVQTPVGCFQRVAVEQSDATLIDANFVVAEHLRRTNHYETPYREADHLAPPEMIGFITGGERTLDIVREAITAISPTPEQRGARGEQLVFQLDQVRLRAPLPRPRRIHDFMAIEEHVRNSMKN